MAFATQTCYTNRMEQDVFDNWPYVQKRGNKYGVRLRVPDDLREILGKGEVTRSLGTGDPVAAKKKYHEICAEVEAEFSAARERTKPTMPPLLSEEMAANLVDAYFREQIYQEEAVAHQVGNDLSLPIEDRRDKRNEFLAEIGQDLEAARFAGESATKGIADAILKANGFPEIVRRPNQAAHRSRSSYLPKEAHVDRQSSGFKRLLRLTYLAQVEVWERVLAILEGKTFDQSRSMFPNFIQQPALLSGQTSQGAMLNSHGANPISIEELFRRYWIAKPPTGTDAKKTRTVKDMDASYRVLIELFGAESDANTLTKQNFRDMLAFLRRMPKQIGNKKKWAHKSLAEIVEEVEASSVFEDDRLSPRTVNKYIRRVSRVFEWAADEPLIVRNLAARIFVPEDEIEDVNDRKPFSIDQLNRIFSSDDLVNPKKDAPSIYWASLFSLLHGMRSEEILQLRAGDFRTNEDGIWLVDIHKKDGNFLKNKPSIRLVPLHPKMTNFGLQSLVKSAQMRSDKRLFPDVPRGAEGRFTPIFSKRYSRFLSKIHAKTENTSFHSFRHNFRDAARNCSVSDEQACSLGGWAIGSGAHANYGSGFWMDVKNAAIQKIDYRKIDLSKVRVIDW